MTETTSNIPPSLWSKIFNRTESSARDKIEELISPTEDTEDTDESFGEEERVLFANILNLRDRRVSDIMVPRVDIVALEEETPMNEVLEKMCQEAHSRMPVYRGQLDEITGMVHIKDIMTRIAEQNGVEGSLDKCKLTDTIREILIVAPSMRVMDLLLDMRQSGRHMALVVDEFGGIDGLVTIEDLVEEIVGEIRDEHDDPEAQYLVRKPNGTLLIDARLDIEDFETEFGKILSEQEREEIDTMGGLVFSLAGRVPARGEVIKHASGLEFEIMDAGPRQVKRLRVTRPTDS